FTTEPHLTFEIHLLRGQIEYLRDPGAAARLLLAEAAPFEAERPADAAVLVATATFASVRIRDAAGALEMAERARLLAERAAVVDPFVAVVRGAALLLNGRFREATPLLHHAGSLLDEAAPALTGPDAPRILDRYILGWESLLTLGHLHQAQRVAELLAGRYGQAVEIYERDVGQLVEHDALLLYPEYGDLVEAYVRAGRRIEAEARLAPFARQAEESEWPWALARLAHLHGLFAEE